MGLLNPKFIAGELAVNRLGYEAMRITGNGIWGDPRIQRSAGAF